MLHLQIWADWTQFRTTALSPVLTPTWRSIRSMPDRLSEDRRRGPRAENIPGGQSILSTSRAPIIAFEVNLDCLGSRDMTPAQVQEPLISFGYDHFLDDRSQRRRHARRWADGQARHGRLHRCKGKGRVARRGSGSLQPHQVRKTATGAVRLKIAYVLPARWGETTSWSKTSRHMARSLEDQSTEVEVIGPLRERSRARGGVKRRLYRVFGGHSAFPWRSSCA